MLLVSTGGVYQSGVGAEDKFQFRLEKVNNVSDIFVVFSDESTC